MENGQKNTKKIIASIAVVLAVLLAVAGLTIWSYHVYQANNDPTAPGQTDISGESASGSEPAGDESAAAKSGGSTQSGSNSTTGKRGGAADLPDLSIPKEVLEQLTKPNATLPAVTPAETATDAAVWGAEDEKPSGGTPVKNLSTVQQIISYFNTAANQVKTGKPALNAKATLRVRENITGSSEAEIPASPIKRGRTSMMPSPWPVRAGRASWRQRALRAQPAPRRMENITSPSS